MKMLRLKQAFPKVLIRSYISLILLGSLVLTLFFACDQFSLIEEIQHSLYKPLTLSPAQVTLWEGETCLFQASGGTKPYRYSAPEALGTIAPETGAYVAPAEVTTGLVQEIILVTDAKQQTTQTTVTILNPLIVTPLVIAPESITTTVGTTGLVFSATGGKPHAAAPLYTFEVIGSGTIIYNEVAVRWEYTAPLTAGEDLIQVTDALGSIDLAKVICVAEENPVVITPAAATQKVGSTENFSVTGGTPPYTYAIQYENSGAVVNGSLDVAPYEIQHTAPGYPDLAHLTVFDAGGKTGFAEITVVVDSAMPLRLTPMQATLKPGESCTFQTVNGTAPFTFTLVSGAGLIDNNGVYTAPATVNSFPSGAEIQVRDSGGEVASALVIIRPGN